MSLIETTWERWSRIIREQRASGQTVAAFCARRGLAVSSFYPWKRRLADAGDVGDAGDGAGHGNGAAFLEARVRAGDDDHRGGGIAIELACGRRVLVAPGFDRRLLQEVLDALESSTGAAS